MLKNERTLELTKMGKLSLRVLPLAIACLLLAGATAKASSLSIVLLAPYQSGPAPLFAFVATVTNTSGSTVYLSADSFNVDAPLTLDDSPFSSGYPLSLSATGPGATYTGLLFNVSVPPATPVNLYAGWFEILGSGDPADNTTVAGSAVFDVNVTPEPSTVVLLLAGLAGLGGILRRRRLAG